MLACRNALAPALLALFIAGCSDAPFEGEPLGLQKAPIINGSVDTTHQAVVAVVGSNWACSGTIIAVDTSQGVGYALTAAHCVENGPAQYVLQGNDYDDADAVYPALDSQAHPSYGGGSAVYDFAMVQFASASAGTPVIPAMSESEDNLGNGTQVRHVGYGKTSYPNGDTTVRHQILGQLSSVQALTLEYDQPNGGPCQGDSGGPNLSVGGAERVAGVISVGDEGCNEYGVSGRVSSVYDSFITPYINNTPVGSQTCDQCTQYATQGQGGCIGTVDACYDDAECNALLTCFNGCSTNACYQGCVDDHPTGYTLYTNIFDCVCDTACVTECEGDATCSGGSGTGAAATGAGVGSGAGPGSGPGSGAGSGVGGGGSGTPGEPGWVAGNADDQEIAGTILESGCGVSRSSGRGAASFAGLFATIALVLLRRRR